MKKLHLKKNEDRKEYMINPELRLVHKTYSLEMSHKSGLKHSSRKCKEGNKSIYATHRVIRLKQTSCLEEILMVLKLRLKRSFAHGYIKNSSLKEYLFLILLIRWLAECQVQFNRHYFWGESKNSGPDM